jgi:hypothetical protein
LLDRLHHHEDVLLKFGPALNATTDVQQQREDLKLCGLVEKVDHVQWNWHQVEAQDLLRDLFGDFGETTDTRLDQVDVAECRRRLNRLFDSLGQTQLQEVVYVVRTNVEHLNEGLNGGEFDFALDLFNRLLVEDVHEFLT